MVIAHSYSELQILWRDCQSQPQGIIFKEAALSTWKLFSLKLTISKWQQKYSLDISGLSKVNGTEIKFWGSWRKILFDVSEIQLFKLSWSVLPTLFLLNFLKDGQSWQHLTLAIFLCYRIKAIHSTHSLNWFVFELLKKHFG